MARLLIGSVLILLLAFANVAGGQGAGSAAILFEDQNTSGPMVLIQAVRLPEDGFVVVHEGPLPEGGPPGEVHGVSGALGAGYHTDVPVVLGSNVTERHVLTAVAYRDTNDNRLFEHREDRSKDTPFRSDGEIVADAARVGPPASREEDGGPGALAFGFGAAGLAAVGLAVERRIRGSDAGDGG